MPFPYESSSNVEPKILLVGGLHSNIFNFVKESIIRSIHFVNNLTVDEDTKRSDKL